MPDRPTRIPMLRIQYMDSQGQITERTVSNIEPQGSDRFVAFCHLRQEERTFILDRVKVAFDEESGEVIDDLGAHLGFRVKRTGNNTLPHFVRPAEGLTSEQAKRQRNDDKYRLFARFKLAAIASAKQCELYSLFDRRCFKCGSPDRLEIDHHVPQVLGGRLVPGNLVVLCSACNALKATKEPTCFYSRTELEQLEQILLAELDLFEFTFDWVMWNKDPRAYLLSLGVTEKDVDEKMKQMAEANITSVRITISIDDVLSKLLGET